MLVKNSCEVISTNIRFLRDYMHITQEKLAFLSGMTTECISRIERNLANPTVQTLDQVANALNVGTIRFFEDNLLLPERECSIELEHYFRKLLELPRERQVEAIELLRNFIGISKLI